MTGFALKVTDENGETILLHVAMEFDDPVYFYDHDTYGCPYGEFRKSYHLTEWIAENKPEWAVEDKTFNIEDIFSKL